MKPEHFWIKEEADKYDDGTPNGYTRWRVSRDGVWRKTIDTKKHGYKHVVEVTELDESFEVKRGLPNGEEIERESIGYANLNTFEFSEKDASIWECLKLAYEAGAHRENRKNKP